MTPEQQRVAIAVACGWEPLPEGRFHPDNPIGQTMPNYPFDLNAMHEVEKGLIGDEPENSELWCDFQTNLVIACPAYLSYHATASQRAEAFLRTIGKWEDSK